MWLQLMRLQFEVVQGPDGIVWGGFGVGLGPKGPKTGPKSIPGDPDRTSDNLSHMSCSHIHRLLKEAASTAQMNDVLAFVP